MSNNIISIDDCTKIVRNSGEATPSFRIVSYRLEEIGGMPGYMAEYAHLMITIEKPDGHIQELRYFTKYVPFGDPVLLSFIRDSGIFSKESTAYRELIGMCNQNPSQVTKWRPSCWLAREELIVMEDLTESGFRSLPNRMDFGTQHILMMLDALAQMHACSLDLEFNQIGGEKFEDKFATTVYETTFMKANTWFAAGLRGIQIVALERSKYAANENCRKRMESEMETKMDKIYELCESTNNFQSVMVHRDLWSNNIMFRFEKNSSDGAINYEKPLSCVLLDFQMARYLPPAVDVLCAIYVLASRTNREEFYDTYVKYYHQVLTEKLRLLHLEIDSILPWQQYLESLDHYRLVGMLWSGVLLQFISFPKGYLDDLHLNDPKAYHEFCNDNRRDVILEFMDKDSYYRDTVLGSVEDTLEYMFGFGAKDCR
ncbi:uncharacterized protein LOC129775307 [Toxorhynchites rutilus septentrionalis]|uniref:uncharacterized protein LOC129775307 n=1 Tax=Toxorhynchites rutilus septentrionalis TaxID=329112 RepID=UPI002478CA30|nr:uncharacterized protein LOC129775307 [Toxorhynchites rutilus septentrionalis]XP_055635864.1 uncharacterized protein LOC129775307 [Toxorhynchites rutilus septentrionalis]XP_055635865.1 uncharacterized protein LOC129775307 [Toxorhynchites rutilus septentrionalis]